VRDLALDLTTGDLAVSAGALALTSDVEAVRQRLQIRLRLWAAEYVLDRRVGVPYLELLPRKDDGRALESTLREAVETCPGVDRVENFTFIRGADRTATCSFRARTTTGAVVDFAPFTPGAV
jgi:hypothetical protein